MSVRDQIVKLVRAEKGQRYYSMNYSASKGFGGEGTNLVGEGWGCAELSSYPYNVLLGTDYVGSCYNFAGDALGQSVNQGGGEWRFVDEPLPGDIVLYLGKGHDGSDYWDYGHAAMYVGDGMVVGSWGKGIPGMNGYWAGRGVSEDPISAQTLGNGWRYIRCTRLDETPKQLVVDGLIGAASTRAWQAAQGTYVDGVISGQVADWQRTYFPSILSCTYEQTGSSLVYAIQRKLKAAGHYGAAADGLIGPNTVKAIQTYLLKLGYYNGDIDGLFGYRSAVALQECLNDERWN